MPTLAEVLAARGGQSQGRVDPLTGQTRITPQSLAMSLLQRQQRTPTSLAEGLAQGLGSLGQGFIGRQMLQGQREERQESANELAAALAGGAPGGEGPTRERAAFQGRREKLAQALLDNPALARGAKSVQAAEKLGELTGNDRLTNALLGIETPDPEFREVNGQLVQIDPQEGTATPIFGEPDQPDQPSIVRQAEFAFPNDPEKQRQFIRERGGSGVNVDLGGLADKERIKDLQERRNTIQQRKTAAVSLARLGNRIRTQLEKGGAATIGPVGFLSRLGNSLSAQARAIARNSDAEFDPERFDFAAFPETARQSAAVRSNILSMAFALARTREEGRLSDTEVQQALNSIGGNSGSPEQIMAAINEVVPNAIQGIDDQIAIERSNFEGTPVNPPTFLSEDLKARNITIPERSSSGQRQAPAQATPETGQAPEGLPQGSQRVGRTRDGSVVWETPDGRRLVVE